MDFSWLATFAENNAALFAILVVVTLFFKFGLPYFKDSFNLFKAHAEKLDGVAADIKDLKESDKRQDYAIKELSTEQFKKIVYNETGNIPIMDRIANYVRCRRLGVNGKTKEYFYSHIEPENKELVQSVFDMMKFDENDYPTRSSI